MSEPSLGVVVIGRNEGERLKRCLRSVCEQADCPIVYVDSGSTDGSVEFAQGMGVTVLDLDMNSPFTMARGRNSGFRHLMENHPELALVQFVDGDCEVEAGWIDTAVAALGQHEGVGVVCGRRRERFPEHTVYNRLTDMEWDTPIGEADACGGDAMYWTRVYQQVDGFNETMIAGEEPELCVRIRAAGWKILRLDAPMTIHDAAIDQFSQWWTRSVRSGHARAEGVVLHGAPPERHNVREAISDLLYGLALPLAMLGGAAVAPLTPPPLSWLGLAGVALPLLAYVMLYVRVAGHRREQGWSPEDARMYSRFLVIGKFAETAGILKYLMHRIRGQRSGLIEYKTNPSS